jgi:FtsH-binding integral membrane protein
MPIGCAILSIISLFLSIGVLKMARDPRICRLWWMDLLGVLDVDSDRRSRKIQEQQMAAMFYLIFILVAALCLSCIYWTVDGIREFRREKNVIEREIEMGREEIEDVRRKTGK